MEDSTSTMGGRCDVLVPDNDEAAALEPQRELHEECEKCVGDNACRGVIDQSGIGCGSCIGLYSCAYLASDATIGDNSCVGELACDSASGEFNNVRLVGNKKSFEHFSSSASLVFVSLGFTVNVSDNSW